MVDRLKGSTRHNIKEGRPKSAGPARKAVFLVAGNKSGQWKSWYATAIAIADERFAEHMADLKEEERS